MSFEVHNTISQFTLPDTIKAKRPDPAKARSEATWQRNKCCGAGIISAIGLGCLTYYGMRSIKASEGVATTMATLVAIPPLLCLSGCCGGCAHLGIQMVTDEKRAELDRWNAVDNLIQNKNFATTWAASTAVIDELNNNQDFTHLKTTVSAMASHLDSWADAIEKLEDGNKKTQAQAILRDMAVHANECHVIAQGFQDAHNHRNNLSSFERGQLLGKNFVAMFGIFPAAKARFVALEHALHTGDAIETQSLEDAIASGDRIRAFSITGNTNHSLQFPLDP